LSPFGGLLGLIEVIAKYIEEQDVDPQDDDDFKVTE
jgi:hypothetical protein